MVFYTFVFPIICLVIFASIWGRFPDYVNILTSGLTGMITLNIAVYGTGLALSFYRQYGYYKRLAITPVKEITYIFGLVISRLIIVFLTINLFLILSHLIYGFHPKGSIFDFNLMLLIGAISLMALSIFIVSLGSTQHNIMQAANLLFFPMLFLGGTFYSLEYMPNFLKVLAYVFPYTYFVQGLSNIAVKGNSIYQNILEIVVLFIWLVICTIFAIKRFKFEEVL